jgi:hypothetical protein
MKRIYSTFFFSLICSLVIPFEAAAAKELPVERFSPTLKANTLDGWELKTRRGKPDFSVVEEEGNYVLRLRSEKSSFRLEKKINVDYRKYPIVSWRWKVIKLPHGGDARNKKTDDQAAQIYFSFSNHRGWLRNRFTTDCLGYIWENLTPAITTQVCKTWKRIRYFVLRNGKEKQKIGQWVTEKRNLAEDFKKIFGKEIPKYQFGIALMIDSDDTKSNAESYFDDIVFLSN